MATLQGRAIKDTYKDLLQVSTNNNTGVTSSMSTVEDGEGTSSALEISTTGVKVDGTLEVTGNVTGVPHVDYRGNYSGSTAYVADDVVFFNGSSYIAKQSSSGNAPTNTTYWGLLAQKGTDGTGGTNGTNGTDGTNGTNGTNGDGFTGGNYNSSTGVVTFTSNDGLGFSTGDLRGASGSGSSFDGGSVSNAITVNASVPQLTLNDTDEGSSELGNSAILSCNTNAFRVALGNDSVSRLTLESFNHPSDSNDTTIYSGIQLNSGLAMGLQKSSAMIEKYVSTANGAAFWLDEGVSWNFRGHEAKNYHRMFIKNQGSAGTLGTDGAGGTALQLEQDVDGFNAEAQIVRNVGTYNGTNYGVTSDYPRGNVIDHQGNMQVQANDGRFSLNYICHIDNPNLWYNTTSSSGLTTSGGGSFGNIAGVYIYGQGLVDANQNRCLAPQGGSMDLGSTDSAEEWRDLYVQNNPTVSSDRNLKQDIEALSDAEKRVATALKGMVKKYRFKSAFAEKGEDARIHIGFIAQEVEEAFSAEGLDPFRYAILVKNTNYKIFVNGTDTGITQNSNNHVKNELLKESIKDSDEVTYEAFEKYSLRYEELHSFIISAL
jgi:hypothetical protein